MLRHDIFSVIQGVIAWYFKFLHCATVWNEDLQFETGSINWLENQRRDVSQILTQNFEQARASYKKFPIFLEMI